MPTFLVFGATGATGRHLVAMCLAQGHTVRAFVRSPQKLANVVPAHANLEVTQGSLSDLQDSPERLDTLLVGVNYIVSMLGDGKAQQTSKVNLAFVQTLVPAMRKNKVKRFLYQAGALSKHWEKPLPFMFWLIRNTLARGGGLIGQHEDNEAVIQYLHSEAQDIEWSVHRAAVTSDNPSKGTLRRSVNDEYSIGTFVDIASYNYAIVQDASAIHTADLSVYDK
ncbi:NmrA family protein [Chytriomyces sp. MP71]|nr:NmrA family protein [Chytriomyces sp. MP71]